MSTLQHACAMENIPDSTDWLSTPLKDFADLENALHCQICKEFYDTPMITSCAHTFCSKCIRTTLSADGRCPACRTADQASKLRNNWALQEVVATFTAARPAAIAVARREQEELAARANRPGKRKRMPAGPEDMDGAETGGRTTRSKSRRIAASQTSQTDLIEVEDSEDEDAYEPETAQDDGLVECPLGCGRRMKIEQVEPHLDKCEDEKKVASRAKSRTPNNSFRDSTPASRPSAKPQERIAELNYSLLKENAMRKKLEEIGVPAWGGKQLMVKRHTEWVNLWNANCDSNHPRTKRELLQDLDTWERTQGGRAPNNQISAASGVMRKDFDGAGWATKNKDEFSRLIADARRKKSNPATMSSSLGKEGSTDEDPSKSALNGNEGASPHFGSGARPSIASLTVSPTPAPYAEHPEALASVREKVEAVNAGEPIEPASNAGFRRDINSSTEDPQPSEKRSSAPGFDNTALLAQSHFGADRKSGSEDEHRPDGVKGSPCDLPAHLTTSPRKIPMFAMPQQPITDVETGGVGDGAQLQ